MERLTIITGHCITLYGFHLQKQAAIQWYRHWSCFETLSRLRDTLISQKNCGLFHLQYLQQKKEQKWLLKILVLGQGRHPAPNVRVVVWCRRDRLWQSPSRTHIVAHDIFFCNKPLKKSISKISVEKCCEQPYAVISLANPGPRFGIQCGH